MKIQSSSIIAGFFKDDIGHRGQHFIKNSMPSYSFHLAWQDLPIETQSLALTFIDHDAIPVCGFTWIHWLVANIDPKLGQLVENTSITGDLIEGVNSWHSSLLPAERRLTQAEATGFGGCAPPDQAHLYTISLYALDQALPLSRGFTMNKLLQAIEGHILDQATLQAWYKTKS